MITLKEARRIIAAAEAGATELLWAPSASVAVAVLKIRPSLMPVH